MLDNFSVCLLQTMGTRVYIGHVSHHCRERDVEKFFKGYGKLRDVMIKNGYCFVVSN